MTQKILYAIAALAAAVVLFACGITLGTRLHARSEQVQPNSEISDTPTDETTDETADDSSNENAVDADTGSLSIDWLAPSERETLEINFYLRGWLEQDESLKEVSHRFSAQRIGMVTAGPYEGMNILAESLTIEEMGASTKTYYLLQPQKGDDHPVLLTKYVEEAEAWSGIHTWSAVPAFDPNVTFGMTLSDATVNAFETPPEILATEQGTVTFIGAGDRSDGVQTDPSADPTVLHANAGDKTVALRLHERAYNDFVGHPNELYYLSDDGRPVWYTVNVPFWNKENMTVTEPVGVPSVTFSDEKQNEQTYSKGQPSGCGFGLLTNVDTDPPELALAGTMTGRTDVKIYEPTDYGATRFDDVYAVWSNNNDGASRAAFAKSHPLFYFQDMLGRWIVFTKNDVLPAVECGKPVIYLYPTETTDVSVALSPKGGFTKTEPAYGNGWNVVASPDGRLVNKTDGKTYPYLFWEGRGGLYRSPTQYWVVKREQVHAFLTETLARLGLNEGETKDFLEFWEPRMQAAPYYKIGFLGTSAMNAIAPMRVSPAPDTVLRVLMDYQELDHAVPSNPPTLPPTPARDGFTVVEWGGVLR